MVYNFQLLTRQRMTDKRFKIHAPLTPTERREMDNREPCYVCNAQGQVIGRLDSVDTLDTMLAKTNLQQAK